MLLTTDLISSPLILAVLYLVVLIYSLKTTLRTTSAGALLSLRSLFGLSCCLCALLRFIAFTSLGLINLYAHTDDDGIARDSPDWDFFEKALLVLFDLPDFVISSAYLLLVLKWAEYFLRSRRHWMDSVAYRRRFVLMYVVFNAALYLAQMSLYALLFVAAVDQDILAKAIYYTLAIINFVLPLVWGFLFLVLEFQFAGFPPSSQLATHRYQSISRLCEVWTASRILWAIVTLSTAVEGWLRYVKSSELVKALLIVLLFAALEAGPILLALRALPALVEREEQVEVPPEEQILLQRGGIWEEVEEEQRRGMSSYSPLLPRTPSSLRLLDTNLYLRVLQDATTPVKSPRGSASYQRGGTSPPREVGTPTRTYSPKCSFESPLKGDAPDKLEYSVL